MSFGHGGKRTESVHNNNNNNNNLRGENPTSRTGVEPSPFNIGNKLAWPRASILGILRNEVQTETERKSVTASYISEAYPSGRLDARLH